MLVQFAFNNYKCFKDETVLSLVAPNNTPKYYTHQRSQQGNDLFKTLALYGANASGKSKLFDAFDFMKSVVVPPRSKSGVPQLDSWKSNYDTFKLNTYSEKESSFFEVEIVIDEDCFRYGFELNGNSFISEWLFVETDSGEEENIFSRDSKGVHYNEKYIKATIAQTVVSANMVSDDACFLVILQTFNEPMARKIVNWFKNAIVISANNIGASMPIPALIQSEKKKFIVSFLKAFDINIEDISPHEMDVDEIPEKIKAMMGEEQLKGGLYDGIRTSHKRYNELYERVDDIWFSLEKDESYGTNRLLSMSWEIIDSLAKGKVLFIDEFDSGIHPLIAQVIVGMFYRTAKSSQLIINTQNVSLLNEKTPHNKKMFRKDQIVLVNKNRYGESSLVSLSEYGNDLRGNLEKLYKEGDLGAIPYIVLDRIEEIIHND